MKKFILIVVAILFFAVNAIPESEVSSIDETGSKVLIKMLRDSRIKKMNSKQFEDFLNHLGKRESSNNPNSVNSLGYIGEFQFGKAALKDVGYSNITIKEFRKDPTIFPKSEQKKAVTKLIKLNFKRFEKLADKYDGKVINGVKVTKSGLIGAAHLAGAGGVKKFLRTNGQYDPCDAYGTHLSDYLKEFAGHNFDLALI